MRKRYFTISTIVFLLFACAPKENELPSPTSIESKPSTNTPAPTIKQPTQPTGRTVLTFDQLTDNFNPGSPLDDGAFAKPADAKTAKHIFKGRLELIDEETNGDIKVWRGNPNVEPKVPHLPEFNFEFVQSGNYFIPVQRGLIITEHPNWNYILEPGRVWWEEGDGSFSRVSFPFALVWKGSNAIFNGVMTFLFNDDGISKVWYQTTQETAISFHADFWGQLNAVYHTSPVENAEKICSDFAVELAQKYPTKPIEQLAEDYPQIDISKFGRGISKIHLTYYGFVFNGVNYLSECPTRYGEYAYCEYMRAPSYSTAKSTFPSMALMHLAQKYDPKAPELLIKDYVPEYVNSPGDWSAVTFDHTLDMATGNFRSASFMEDEEHFGTDPFWIEEYYDERIAAAFNWPNSTKPGLQWVYRTFDTFILTRALHNYLQSIEGSQADIFNFLVDEIFTPLGIGPGAHTTLRTKDNNWQGQPYGGYGLWWIPDDIAKISEFLNVDKGVIEGQQILHPELLAGAMQTDPDDRGVDIDSRAKYNNAFWARVYDQREGFDCEFWVPHMLGYSGIVIVMMPNGSSYYYASDNREFSWLEVLKEADKIAPFCPP